MRFRYLQWDDKYNRRKDKPPFETLWDLFQELLTLSGGDVAQSLKWLTELDKEYGLTDQFEEGYGIGQFVEEMKNRGYIEFDDDLSVMIPTGKASQSIRKKSLEQIFNQLKKGGAGNHKSPYSGKGLERQPETRNWRPGDDLSQIDSTGTMMNMLKHSSLDQF
ncbi:MAG: hypothetical protein WD317_08055, partial [Balneolaceae bacterium]